MHSIALDPRCILLSVCLTSVLTATGAAQSQKGPAYHVAHEFRLGGNGRWDYVAIDTVGTRLFIAREDRVMVVDPITGKLLGEIPGLRGAHGVAFDYAHGRGFSTSGRDSSVTMFDLQTLGVLRRIPAGDDADAILYDPASKHVFTFNGDAGSSTVIDPLSGKVIGTIALDGKPEFGVSSDEGKLYVNIEDAGEVVEIDPVARRVVRRWSIAPCTEPTGLAIDRGHHRLFSACRNRLMAISDAIAGKLIATVPIGAGVDGAAFDSATGLAFASNGEGTVTVIQEQRPDSFSVVASAPTRRGARTMALDSRTHRLYTVTADLGPSPAPTTAEPHPRPSIVPGTFTLLVLEP